MSDLLSRVKGIAALPVERLLLVYLRLIAVFFLLSGLAHWVGLLHLPTDPAAPFSTLSPTARGTLILFSILDPVAAVGLWLASAWGIVVWLLVALGRMLLDAGLVEGVDAQPIMLAVNAASIVVYLVLSLLAQRAAARAG